MFSLDCSIDIHQYSILLKLDVLSSGATFNYDYDGLNIQHGSAFALLIIYTNVIVYCMNVILFEMPKLKPLTK